MRSGHDESNGQALQHHNPEVTLNDVTNAVRSREFDAVLFTRVKGSMQAVVKRLNRDKLIGSK